MSRFRERWLAEKRAEIAGLRGLDLTEVVPSRRDFTQFVATQKSGIALVPRLQRADPETGGAWPGLDFAAFAQACDDAEAAALAVRTAARFGGAVADLDIVVAAATAPVLCDDLCLDPRQIYEARLHGADALLLPAAHLDAPALRELVAVAGSVHMAAVIEVTREDDLAPALACATACVGLTCPGADGFADLARVRALAARVPRQRTLLLLSEVAHLPALRALDGAIDAAVVGDALLGADDPAAIMAAFLAHP